MGQYKIKDVQNRAELLKEATDNIFRAIYTKTGNSLETLDQVPGSIMSIPQPPTQEPLTITPTIDVQKISAFDNVKYDPITVEPVTSAIDSNIRPENIKEGFSILGVKGSHKGEKPEVSFDVQPTTAEQTITPGEGYVFASGTVHAVTSAIDNNIVAGNIKEGVSILGVAGTLKREKPEETFNVQPTTAVQTITPTEGYVFSGGTVNGVTSAIDSNIQPENIKEGVSILGVTGTLSGGGGSDVFVVPPEMRFGASKFTEVPSNYDFREFSNVTDMSYMFYKCENLNNIPQLDLSNVSNMSYMFSYCSSLTSIPSLDIPRVWNMGGTFSYCRQITVIHPLDTSKVTIMTDLLNACDSLTTVEGIDFSGLTSDLRILFGYTSSKPKLTRFIVNGKINVNISDSYSIKALTAIDYDSVKSILEAANRTDNTNAKTLAFNRTIADQNGELAALVASCTSKGWTISGLTLQ